MLKPGGRFVFAGEPTRHGDYIARRLSRRPGGRRRTPPDCRARGVAAAAGGARRVLARGGAGGRRRHPHLPAATSSRRPLVGPARSTYGSRPPELIASWFGWPVRTFECAVPREKLGFGWANFAMKGWQRLSALDERARARRADGAVLQRRDHRREAIAVLPAFVLFDLDGTLSDSAPGILASLRHAFDVHGIPPLDAARRELLGPPFYESLPPFVGADRLCDVIDAYREFYAPAACTTRPCYDGVARCWPRSRARRRGWRSRRASPSPMRSDRRAARPGGRTSTPIGGDSSDGSLHRRRWSSARCSTGSAIPTRPRC